MIRVYTTTVLWLLLELSPRAVLEYVLQSKSYGPSRERGEYAALERNELSRREKTQRALNTYQ